MSLLDFSIADKLSPALRQIGAQLDGAGRALVSEGMAIEVRSLIVRHLAELGDSRHTTANRLGAQPTGFIASLAENFDQSSTVAFDSVAATITMRHPTILRATRDVTITAKKQFLTIPLNAAAYGRRVGEFAKFRLVKKGGGKGGEKKAAKPFDDSIPAWLLVRSVTQRRDPTLLPTMDEIADAGATGARRVIHDTLSKAGLS